MQYSGDLASFLAWLNQCESLYKNAEDELELAEKQEVDIRHYIELEEPMPFDHICLGIAQRQILKKRREAKDTMQVLEPLMSWIRRNQTQVCGLQKALRLMRHEEGSLSRRHYMPRTDIIDRTLGGWEVDTYD